MKNLNTTILSALLLATTSSTFADEKQKDTEASNPSDVMVISVGCDPTPECNSPGAYSNSSQHWIDSLLMQQFLDQLKTNQEQPAVKNSNRNK